MVRRYARQLLPLLLGITGCAAGGRDVVPESQDVRVEGRSPTTPGDSSGYVYVAKRPLAVVALAEARGIPDDVGRAVVDRLADALDACTTEQARKGTMVSGAARAVALIDDQGNVRPDMLVKVDPAAASSTAMLCLAWPMKQLTFVANNGAGQRGFALEALWGTLPTPPRPQGTRAPGL
jgi:hypothetical protein